MESAQQWAYIMACGAKAFDNAMDSTEWESHVKNGMDFNHSLLAYSIQSSIETGYANGMLLGRGIRETSDAMKHLVPMANFTQAAAEAAAADALAAAGTALEEKTKLASAEAAAKSSMAKEYFAYVKAKGLNSNVIQSEGNSSRKCFSRTPGCFFHNADDVGKQAWEIRGHFASNTAERTAHLFKAWKESELQEQGQSKLCR